MYAMPLGGNKVFLQETCLVAKPPLPFAILKRRLERRLKAMGVKVSKWHVVQPQVLQFQYNMAALVYCLVFCCTI